MASTNGDEKDENDEVVLAFGPLGKEYKLIELPKQITEGE
eukprot:CAMPEP_0201535406 /NCGR_PEP_ID=MMETSP0161_2-20130828/58946_1 /ASSEMBLY_ACC=CAM_ASM_000251 /TAXON_ID=180227 /ORGANISM="Neoparamoeba aestuarina, Strain SoJaBio B1-5/56/2" /LENGTH=39 /DNA_ID= /DNA_START= /DNA_END= /DNA_ORIENTATION=